MKIKPQEIAALKAGEKFFETTVTIRWAGREPFRQALEDVRTMIDAFRPAEQRFDGRVALEIKYDPSYEPGTNEQLASLKPLKPTKKSPRKLKKISATGKGEVVITDPDELDRELSK